MASGGAPGGPRLRSRETPPLRGRSRSSRRARLVAGSVGRIIALLVVVLGSGAVAGVALGLPLRSLDLGGSDAVVLDQVALAGSIDAEQALVTLADLPKSYADAPSTFADGVALVAADYCGHTVTPEGQVGTRLAKAYVDTKNTAFVLTEVVKTRRQQDAGEYVRGMIAVLENCPDGKYYRKDANGESEQVRIVDERTDAPLAEDYVTRTIRPVKGGPIQIVTYFQVGNVIVAIEYAGPDKPPKSLMRNAELEVLYRVAPDQLSKTAKVRGQKELPGETTTTSTPDAVQPSPTSSPPLPTTIAPPPTFEPPTTTRKPGTRRSATTVPATQPAVTAAPN